MHPYYVSFFLATIFASASILDTLGTFLFAHFFLLFIHPSSHVHLDCSLPCLCLGSDYRMQLLSFLPNTAFHFIDGRRQLVPLFLESMFRIKNY